MRKLNKYLGLLLLGTLSLTACQDDVDDPSFNEPESTWLTDADNYQLMTISEVKAKFWSDDTNYYWTDPEGNPYLPKSDDGRHILIKGRVISSDAAGNVYKKLVIQDETAAVTFSINANSMNNKFRRGQEIVVDITGMTIGKYAGLQQFGAPDDSETYGHQTTFMAYEFFLEHVQMNGLPDLAKIDTLVVRDFSQLSGGPEVIRKWQSQLVRFNNCSFVNGGTETFARNKETVSQTLNVEGGSLDVRTSGYSNFYSDVLPEGKGDVVALLEYFNSAYQLTLIDRAGCMNFGNPTIGPGGEDNPYTVDEAISIIAGGGSVNNVWLKGYIVGAVAAGVQDVSGNSDIEFAGNPDLPNTLVIATDAQCKDWSKCMVIELPQNSALRQYGNLVDNPDNYQKEIMILGNLGKVLGTYGVTGNNGAAATFKIDGVDVPDDGGNVGPTGNTAPDFNTMNEGQATGYYQAEMKSKNGWVATNSQLLQGGSSDSSPVFTVFGSSSVFAPCLNGKAGSHGTLTSPVIGGGLKTLTFDYTQPFSDTKCKLTINIKQNGKVVATDVLVNDGMTKLQKYSYSHDFNVDGNFQIEIINDGPSESTSNKDRVAIWNISWGEGTGSDPEQPGTPDQPAPTGNTAPDFNTMNNGQATGYYQAEMKSTNGWVATNSQLLQGGSADSSPVFTVFGDSSVFAPCLNGKAGSHGTLTSPVIGGGLKTLTFDYTQPFSDTKCKLTINIKQNGTVVASDEILNPGMTKLQKYSYSHAFNISGNFQIEIINDGPSESTSNKDRVAIWNVAWTSM